MAAASLELRGHFLYRRWLPLTPQRMQMSFFITFA